MSAKEQLYYLLIHAKKGDYDINTFSDLFTDIMNLELYKEDCTDAEYEIFSELEQYTCRFSPFEEDLKMFPNTYYDEETVSEQIDIAIENLGIDI